MKKIATTTLALAAVLGAAGASHAASSVTVYGLVDVGFMNDHDDVKGTTSGIDSGSESGSRWGLKGVEDLGNGVKANFLLENGFTADDGALSQDGRLFGRWAYVGLESASLGEVRVGRQWVLGRDWGGVATPFGIGWSRGGLGTTFGYNDGDFGASGIADNMVMYRSPKISGFEAALGYSFSQDGTEAAGGSNNDRLMTSGVRYANGPLRVALTYERVFVDQARVIGKTNPATNASNWQLGASYDFKVARVHAGLGRVADANKGPAKDVDTDYGWTVGVNVPLGAGSLLAAWQQTTDSKIKGYALGYQYDLSKRTDLYAFLNHTDTRDLDTGDDNGRRQIGVGIRHRF